MLLKLRRQFHGMADRQDMTGFQIETLPNGYLRYVLNVSSMLPSFSYFPLVEALQTRTYEKILERS